MNSERNTRASGIRAAIDQYLDERLAEKLEPLLKKQAKAEPDSSNHQNASAQITRRRAEFERLTWLASAAERSGRVKLVTHVLKMAHGEAKGTNILLSADAFADDKLLSTRTLGKMRIADGVCKNAPELPIFKFLVQFGYEGRSMLALARSADPDFIAALSDDSERSAEWAAAFATLAELEGQPASHPLAKQLYWPLDNGGYRLLAPLASSSLAHAAHHRINDDRFSEAAKAARAARKAKQWSERPVREYPNLVSQQLGGSKPQNISQLNSERRGVNYLLPSCPPIWRSDEVKPPLRVESVFGSVLAFQPGMREVLKTLTNFLNSVRDYNNLAIRDKSRELVGMVVAMTIAYGIRIRELPGGWSRDSQLVPAERYWLDPKLCLDDKEFAGARAASDWPRVIADRFAGWFNGELRRAKLPAADEEHREWRADFRSELALFREELRDDD